MNLNSILKTSAVDNRFDLLSISKEVSPMELFLSRTQTKKCTQSFQIELNLPLETGVELYGGILGNSFSLPILYLLDPICYMGRVSDSVCVSVCLTSDSCPLIDLPC